MNERRRFSHRLARSEDIGALRAVIDTSIRTLLSPYLNADQVEASFAVMGLDTQLIDDVTYFIVECAGQIAGCGGWSRRATLFGGDHSADRDARPLDPLSEAARFRAMYTHPDFSRQGVGRLILSLSETAARSERFARAELGATMAGMPLYRACGCEEIERLDVATPSGVTVPIVRMGKSIQPMQNKAGAPH